MSLYNVLPPPRHVYTTAIPSHPNHSAPLLNHQQLEIARLNSNIPPYGQRQGYIPREPEDFGDGGAFPEIFIKQYPLDMGRQDLKKTTSSVVALKVNEKGEVQYDAILRENMRKNQIMHSTYKDLVPKDELSDDELMKPSEDTAIEATEATRKALEKMINQQIESIRPAHSNLKQNKPVTVRYQSANSVANGAQIQSRLIKIYEMPTDPLDPPKFKHKKLPPRPPSPPVPIMHSPPRQVTVEDQKNWKVPPCVSNWKNNKGFTLPLHQRLAADGRGLYNHVINDKFAKFSEALLIAERQARKEVEARAQMRLKLSKKQKQQKEKELAAMAKSAKEAAKYNEYISVNAESEDKRQRDMSEYDADRARKHAKHNRNRKRKRDHESSEDSGDSDSGSDSASSNDSEEDERRKAYEERENIRRERERERKRQYRLDRKKTGKNNSVRQRERDISERIALGQFSGKKSTESLYDNRLFNQESGLNTGFAADDSYHLYDRPLFKSKSRKIYRPTVDEEMYGMDGVDLLNEKSDKIRPHKGFEGAEENRNGNKKKRFEFEKDVQEEEGNELEEELERFTTAKERKQVNGHQKGYMYAAGGGGGNVDGVWNRDKVMFEAGKEKEDDLNANGGRNAGLYYTEEEMAKKREERRDKRERYRDTRSRSRSLSRSRSHSRERERRYRRTHRRSRSRSRSRSHSRDRNRTHSRDRRERRSDRSPRRRRKDYDKYESRGRWGSGH